MGELRLAAGLFLWGLLPGFILLRLAGVRWSAVEQAAAAPGLSIVTVAFAAYAAEMVGLPVSPLPVAVVLAAAGALIVAARRGDRPGIYFETPSWPFELSPRFGWIPWLVFLAPIAVVLKLQTVSEAALLPPSLHDGLDHANWFRLIFEMRSLSPHEVMAPPLSAAGEPAYYPWGMHAWAALVARTAGIDPVIVFMRAMVAISAMVPLSVYVFSAQFTGRGWTAMAAAVFSLIFWWLPYQVWGWGGYALLAGAVAALPMSRLTLDAAGMRSRGAIALTAVGMAGLLFVHPSQLFLVLVITAVVAMTLAAGGQMPRATALVFIGLIAMSGGAIVAGGMMWQPIADFLQRAREVSVTSAVDPRYRFPIAIFFDTELPRVPELRRIFLTLWVIGAVAAAMHRRMRAVLVLHLVFGALVLGARYQTWMTTLWYHLPERIWYAQLASQPLLAAIGAGASLRLAARILRRWIDVPRWSMVVWPVTIWAVFMPIHAGFDRWAEWRLYLSVYRNPNFAVTDTRLLADFDWMQRNIPRTEVLFNAPADWGLPLPFTGQRTVFWSGGGAFDPSTPWNDWLTLMQRGGAHAAQAAAELSARGVHYVYAGRLNPAWERRGRGSLDAAQLKQVPGLTLLYESPTASIFRVQDVRDTLFGIANSRRLRVDGFHPPEEEGRRRWRWTNGTARASLSLPEGTWRACYLRVYGPSPDVLEVRRDGRALPFGSDGYRLDTPLDPGAITLDLVSPAFVPDSASGDTRTLGVRVTDLGLSCRP